MKETGKMQLFSDFPDISTEAWRNKIETDLKGADFERKLVWKTDEGIPVQPFYRSEDLEGLKHLDHTGSLKPVSDAPNGWIICQDISPGQDPAEANMRIKLALKGGAQAIRIDLGKVADIGKEMLEKLFEGISLGETEILFRGFLGADTLYEHFTTLAAERGVEPAKLRGLLGADPIGKMVSTGIPIATFETLGKLLKKAGESAPGLRVIDVDGSLVQNAGGNLAEELAYTLSMANEYMAILTGKGIDAADVAASMQFSLASGANYFMEIAKIRAARILWSKICELYGLEAENSRIHIHTTSSQWNMTLYDPHVNMLRGTTEAMSSILGGADLITVLPFDSPYGNNSVFSDRVARNAQIILRDEAYLDRVADPSSGSYYIESLTDSLAEKAWEIFRDTEREGGFRRALEKGMVQESVLASRKKKLDRLASGRDHLLGTNSFPNFNEVILEQLKQESETSSLEPDITPLQPFRIAAMFEEVRLDTEKSGKRPSVLMFKYGNPAWATARATFSGNFFACAGYEILDQPAFPTVEAGIEAAKKAGPALIVLCSDDATYPSLAPKLIEAMGDSSVIVVAGYPADSLEELQKAGIKHFIHIKTNPLESLRQFNKILL
ncbi:MAG: methylmalonyl-CoA mutase small subunit [Bacteroidetes bacterium]|nr:methylmalonyl-CoA mutase small subunit [Bacteroidota bacterium]